MSVYLDVDDIGCELHKMNSDARLSPREMQIVRLFVSKCGEFYPFDKRETMTPKARLIFNKVAPESEAE